MHGIDDRSRWDLDSCAGDGSCVALVGSGTDLSSRLSLFSLAV